MGAPFSMSETPVQGRTLKVTVLLLFITLLATALRFYQLGTDSLWLDEIWNTVHAQKEVVSIPASLRESGAHPPLWHLLSHFTLYLGQSEFILRFPAALIGILSIPLIYVVGRRLFGREVGLLASFLLTISPFHLQYSQEARMYTAMLLFSLFSLYFLWRALERSEKGLWIGFILSTLLNIYNTYFAFLVLISEAVFALVVAGTKSRPGKVKGVKRSFGSWFQAFFSSPQVRGLALSLIVVGLLYLPWLPVAKVNLLERQSAREETSGANVAVSLSLILRLVADFSLDDKGLPFLIFVGAFLMGFFDLILSSRWRELLLVILWVAPPLVIVALSGGVRKFHSRYVFYVLPIYLILVAGGPVSLFQLIYRFDKRLGNLEKRSLIGCALIVVTFGALSIVPVREYYAWEKEDWRGGARYLADHMGPSDVILCDGGMYGRGGDSGRCVRGLTYYLSESFQDRHTLATDRNIPQKIKNQAAKARAVWIVFWHGKPLSEGARDTSQTLSQSAEFERVLVTRVGEGENLVENTISALKTLIELQRRSEARFDLHLSLAKIYAWQGDFERAQQALAAAKEVQPHDFTARARLKRISSGLQVE